MSENIQVRSVVGRFLEHSRVYLFEAGPETRVFLGSADMMPRNLDHRIEVVAPVEERRLKDEIQSVFDVLMADNSQAWQLAADGSWERCAAGDDRPRPTHEVLMRRARVRARRSGRPS